MPVFDTIYNYIFYSIIQKNWGRATAIRVEDISVWTTGIILGLFLAFIIVSYLTRGTERYNKESKTVKLLRARHGEVIKIYTNADSLVETFNMLVGLVIMKVFKKQTIQFKGDLSEKLINIAILSIVLFLIMFGIEMVIKII